MVISTQPFPLSFLIVGTSLLLLISVLASKASTHLGVPALLMFLIVGMLAGSEGPGRIPFDNATVAQFMGTIALAYILFYGGLDTNWHAIKPVMRTGLILATVGVLLTAVLVAVFAVLVLRFSWLEGLLLGSVMSSTDAAAVFSILRSRKAALKGRLQPLLELESGSNDPMAVFLTVTTIGLIAHSDQAWWSAIPSFVQQMLLGAAVGWGLGKLAIALVNRIGLEYEGLYSVMTLSLVLLIFGLSDLIGGNGFLAVYIAGLLLGKEDFLHKRSLTRFHGAIAWLMQICMFLTLGLLVFPSHLMQVIGMGFLTAAFLMFVARPLGIMACLFKSRLTMKEKLLTSWVGLRGAVPIVLATFPLMAGVPRAETIFNIVFFVVLTSVLLQGTSIPLVAKWLKLAKPLEEKPRHPLEFERTEASIHAALSDMIVAPDAPAAGKRVLELKLGRGTLVVLIRREGEYFVPSGETVLRSNDVVLAIGEKQSLESLAHMLEAPAPEAGA